MKQWKPWYIDVTSRRWDSWNREQSNNVTNRLIYAIKRIYTHTQKQIMKQWKPWIVVKIASS